MRDLRVRFGMLLGLALLPLLVFAVWQSFSEYNRVSQIQRQSINTAAKESVLELVNSIDTSKAVLRSIALSTDPENCDKAFTELVQQFDAFDRLFVADADGQFICTTSPVKSFENAFDVPERLTPDRPFVTEARNSGPNESSLPLIVIAYGDFENDILKKIYIAGFYQTRIMAFRENGSLPEDSSIAVVNAAGEVLVSSDPDFRQIKREWIKSAEESGRYNSLLKSADGTHRDTVIFATREREVFIVLNAPTQNMFSWDLINPLYSGIPPLLAWLFAFVVIWIAADRLVLTHLRNVKRTTMQFAAGDYSARVGPMASPTHQIAQLGQTFDAMANDIEAREKNLTDALIEKETLLREIHHRVKNNLQIIISLLNIQERKLDTLEGKSAIAEARNRINAIALVHKTLYETDDFQSIQMHDFLEKLSHNLGESLGVSKNSVNIVCDLAVLELEVDNAIPVALFLVEAFSNSVKYGVSKNGVITVRLTRDGDMATIDVTDTGMTNAGPVSANGTGKKLMTGFARQLAGKFKTSLIDGGSRVSLSFPVNAL